MAHHLGMQTSNQDSHPTGGWQRVDDLAHLVRRNEGQTDYSGIIYFTNFSESNEGGITEKSFAK